MILNPLPKHMKQSQKHRTDMDEQMLGSHDNASEEPLLVTHPQLSNNHQNPKFSKTAPRPIVFIFSGNYPLFNFQASVSLPLNFFEAPNRHC